MIKAPLRVLLVESVFCSEGGTGGFAALTRAFVTNLNCACGTTVITGVVNAMCGVAKDSGYDFFVFHVFHFYHFLSDRKVNYIIAPISFFTTFKRREFFENFRYF